MPKHALLVRGGWPGHEPVAATDRCAATLTGAGYRVSISDTLDCYLDADALADTDLVVQCWSMGRATAEQVAGLTEAVRAGTGFAGWHGGVVDAFRDRPEYHLLTGGQFVYHPKEFVRYPVRPAGAHEIMAGIGTFEVHSEQYYVHTDPGNEVLAVTDWVPDPDLPWIGGPTFPVTWVRRHGAGRVFVTTIGHRLDDLEIPEVDTMITRGLAWATR
jgi:type 1 glutamine amidotransferase